MRHPCAKILIPYIGIGGFDISLRGIWMKLNSKREKRFFLVFLFLRHPCALIMLSLDRAKGSLYVFKRILDEID